MRLYQHDSATMFRFVLQGDLSGMSVRDFEQAWHTATSVASQKEIVVDISGVTDADVPAVVLLSRMRESGVRLIAPLPPKSEALLCSLGIPVAAPETRRFGTRAARLIHFWRAVVAATLERKMKPAGAKRIVNGRWKFWMEGPAR